MKMNGQVYVELVRAVAAVSLQHREAVDRSERPLRSALCSAFYASENCNLRALRDREASRGSRVQQCVKQKVGIRIYLFADGRLKVTAFLTSRFESTYMYVHVKHLE